MVNLNYTVKRVPCAVNVDLGRGITVELEFALVVDARSPQHINEGVCAQVQDIAKEMLTQSMTEHEHNQVLREGKRFFINRLTGPIGRIEYWRRLPDGVLVSYVEFARCVIRDGKTVSVSAGVGL